MEKLDVGKFAGKAKLAGTALGLGGAMLLTLYKGPDITVWISTIDLLKAHDISLLILLFGERHRRPFEDEE